MNIMILRLRTKEIEEYNKDKKDVRLLFAVTVTSNDVRTEKMQESEKESEL